MKIILILLLTVSFNLSAVKYIYPSKNKHKGKNPIKEFEFRTHKYRTGNYNHQKRENKKISIFEEKGNRVLTHFGISKFGFDKMGINFGGTYLFYTGNDLFIGPEIDLSLLRYNSNEDKFSGVYVTDFTWIGASTYFEFSNNKNSTVNIVTGLGLYVNNLFYWTEYNFSPYLGIAWLSNKRLFLKAKYTFVSILNSHRTYAINISFGFIFDVRPKKFNQGYYNDEF